MRQPKLSLLGPTVLTRGRPFYLSPYLKCHYSPNNVPFWPASNLLGSLYHPLYFKVLRQVENARNDHLRWYIQPNALGPKLKCVRTRLGRRVRSALQESLKEAGWEKDGKALDGSGKSSILGSLEVMVLAQLDQVPWKEVKEETRKMVNALEREAAKAANPRQSFRPPIDRHRNRNSRNTTSNSKASYATGQSADARAKPVT